MLVPEALPCSVSQRGGGYQEGALAMVHHDTSKQFAANEGFAQPNAVSDQHAIVLSQDAPCSPHAIFLKPGQANAILFEILLL